MLNIHLYISNCFDKPESEVNDTVVTVKFKPPISSKYIKFEDALCHDTNNLNDSAAQKQILLFNV